MTSHARAGLACNITGSGNVNMRMIEKATINAGQ